MATLHFRETTTSTPEQFIGALTDFGPGRSKIFSNSADEFLKVHSQTLGARRRHRGLRRRVGTPGLRLVATRPGRHEDHRLQHLGRTLGPHLHLHPSARRNDRPGRHRRSGGKNLKGRSLGLVLGTVGTGVLRKALKNTVKAIDARNDEAKAADVG